MTERQKMFITFIESFIKDRGYSPSVREIAAGMGLSSTASVKKMLDRLQDGGFLKKVGNIARGIESSVRVPVPVLGRIKAGVPVSSEENIEGYLNMDRIAGEGNFFLRVDGESMKDKAIIDGDYVLIKQTPVIESGQTGAFRINGEVTLKTFRRSDDGIFLMPANKDFKPITVTEYDDFQVIGTLRMVIRLAEGTHDIEPA